MSRRVSRNVVPPKVGIKMEAEAPLAVGARWARNLKDLCSLVEKVIDFRKEADFQKDVTAGSE